MADMYFHTKQTDWGDFYDSLGRTDLPPAGQPSGELTSRSVRTVAIDPFTGQPVAAGGSNANPETLAVLNAQMVGRGQPARMGTASAIAAADRLASQSPGLPINPDGQYNPGNPLVLSALKAQQGAQPTATMASRVTGFGTPRAVPLGPNLPVASTPAIQQAYSDMVAGQPGAQKRYAMLLADAAPTMGQVPVAPGAPRVAAPAKVGPTGVGTNGYTYVNGQNMGYAAEEQAKRITLGRAIAEANRQNPSPTYTVSGDNNSFMPRSVQESVRWQTGY